MTNKIGSPLLSIIIPTHNRARYAFYAIRSILSINSDYIEVVVSDTSDNDMLLKMLSEGETNVIADIRLRYFQPNLKLDMTGNHNYAMAKATGIYVCLIGDDDTITFDAILAADWANRNDVDLIAPEVMANYAWPDFRSIHFGDKHSSRLYLPKDIKGIESQDARKSLLKALNNAAQGTDGLPKIYHGIVKKSILDNIKTIAGEYFFGSSPDVSGAISLAFAVKKYVTVSYPLTIPGASAGSNTGRSAMNKHKGKLDSEAQTKSFKETGWSEGVPKFFSVETVWAHAAIETLKKNEPSLLKEFNFIKLLAVCKSEHSEYKSEFNIAVFEVSKMLNLPIFKVRRLIFKEVIKYRLKRISYILKRAVRPTASGGRLYIDKLKTIEETPNALSNYLLEKNWTWKAIEIKFLDK